MASPNGSKSAMSIPEAQATSAARDGMGHLLGSFINAPAVSGCCVSPCSSESTIPMLSDWVPLAEQWPKK